MILVIVKQKNERARKTNSEWMEQNPKKTCEWKETNADEIWTFTYNGLFEFILNWTIVELFEFFLKSGTKGELRIFRGPEPRLRKERSQVNY